jgi:hypothetical protein
MSTITTHTIQIDGEFIQITIETKPYFRNDTLQPIYIYSTVHTALDTNTNTNTNINTNTNKTIITYYIRGISNKIYTTINNFYIFDILKKNYKTLLPDIDYLDKQFQNANTTTPTTHTN